MSTLRNLSVGRKLYGAFALVAAFFVIAMATMFVLERTAQSVWTHTHVWDQAIAASQLRIDGTRQEMAAQAMSVATLDPAYRVEWAKGVELENRATRIVQSLDDPSVAALLPAASGPRGEIAGGLLFAAVARHDRPGAVAVLRSADGLLRVRLAAQEAFAYRIQQIRDAGLRHAQSLQARAQTIRLSLCLLAVLLSALLAFLITRAIRRPLLAVIAAAERMATGDLSVDVAAESTDEIGTLTRAFQAMVESVRSMVGEVAQAAGRLGSSSHQMATTAEDAGRAATEIASSVESVARGAERQVLVVVQAKTATDEMAQAALRGASNAEGTATAARDARAASEEGVTAVQSASQAMRAVHESSVAVSAAMQTLGSKSEQIGGIVQTITGIAGQTNLLALNAAIEAARAGEQGRGFAVVAEEVRKLAEESQRAAASIAGLVDEIQAETKRTVAVVETGSRRTEDGVAIVEQARDAFVKIGASVEDMSGRVEQIVVAIGQFADSAQRMRTDIEEVSVVAEQSSAATEQVSASTAETSASTQEIAQSAQSLAGTAQLLQDLVGQFKLAA